MISKTKQKSERDAIADIVCIFVVLDVGVLNIHRIIQDEKYDTMSIGTYVSVSFQ